MTMIHYSQGDIVRVWLRSTEVQRMTPVYASIRHKFGIMGLQLPVIADVYLYNVAAHTLCPYDMQFLQAIDCLLSSSLTPLHFAGTSRRRGVK